VFYYAGHAYQMDGVNYLVPVEARPDAAAPQAGTWSMTEILARLQGTGATTLVFLDACRTNPLGAAVGGDGLAAMDGDNGTFIAFATRPGQVSFDRAGGEVSPFAQALLDHIDTPGLGVSDLMIRVRGDVEAATVGRQVPWDQSSLRAPFLFRPAEGDADPVLPQADEDPFAGLVVEETDVQIVLAEPVAEPPVVPRGAEPAPAPVAAAPAPLLRATLPALAGADRLAVPVVAGATPRVAAPVTGPERLAPQGGAGAVGAVQGGTAVALASVGPKGAERIIGTAPQAETASFTPQDGGTAPLTDPATAAPLADDVPEDLPRAIQLELARVGCYSQNIDGQWGNGSRRSLTRYYEAKGVAPVEPLDPTPEVWRGLKVEPEGLCAPEVAAPAPAPSKPKATTPAKKQPAKPKPAAAKPKPKAEPKPKAAAKPKPAGKKEVTCKFMVVAIVCK
jgi:hypothetical protein